MIGILLMIVVDDDDEYSIELRLGDDIPHSIPTD